MIKLKIYGDIRNSMIRVPLAQDKNGNDLCLHMLIVQPNSAHSLAQIPKGANPRDLAPDTKLFKDIKATYEKGPMFLVYNGGMTATIDTGSLTTVKQDNVDYIVFSCDDEDNGHYDGQHSEGAVTAAIENKDLGENNAPFLIILVDDGVYPDSDARRTAAKCTNNRSAQQLKSEMDIRGTFENIKKEINYCAVENIQWKQNQLNAAGDAMKPDCDVLQVINMLGAFLPIASVSGGEVGDISKWEKQGSSAFKHLENETLAPYLNATYEHIDFILDMADFIRMTTREVLGDKAESFGIVKKNTAGERKKDFENRKPLQTQLFNGALQEYGLNKDIMPLILHAIIDATFEYDECREKYVTDYKLEELKAMWLEGGFGVLHVIETEFKNCFEDKYKSRWSDFVLDTLLWTKVRNAFRRVPWRAKDWKSHLNHELVG